jgi:hypothetical protein
MVRTSVSNRVASSGGPSHGLAIEESPLIIQNSPQLNCQHNPTPTKKDWAVCTFAGQPQKPRKKAARSAARL